MPAWSYSGGSNGNSASIRSTERPIDCSRSRRHAHTDGLTKCTVRTPRRLSRRSRPRLKSGASTPMKTGTRAARNRRAMSRRSEINPGRCATTSVEAAHGQALQRRPGFAAGRLHPRTGNAGEADRRIVAADCVDERSAQRVAGRFARNDSDRDRRRCPQTAHRTMPRPLSARNATSGASSGNSAAAFDSDSRASSSDRPVR